MRNELNKLLKQNRIDKILLEITNLLVNYYNVNDYVKSIELRPLDYDICGAYSDEIKKLVINKYILDIMYQKYDEKGLSYNFIDENKYTKNEILITILHELGHAIQHKQIIENPNNLKSIIFKDTRMIEDEDFYYQDPNEKDANMFSYQELLKIINIEELYDIDILEMIKSDYTRKIIPVGYNYKHLENGTLESSYKTYVKNIEKYKALLNELNKLNPIDKIKLNHSLTEFDKQILSHDLEREFTLIKK